MTNPTFRLLDFQVKNEKGMGKRGRDNKKFVIEMFGTPVENVENRNDRGALSRWYRTPPLAEVSTSSTTEPLIEEKETEELQDRAIDKLHDLGSQGFGWKLRVPAKDLK